MADTPSADALTFSFPAYQLRTVMRDSEPWFVAADVCAALQIANPSDALKRLDADERTLDSIEGIRGGPGNPNVHLVNESGLYSLILGSRKPEAKRFKKWVTAEVLPAIRRTGRYEGPAPESGMLTNLMGQLGTMQARIAERDAVIALKDQAITGLQGHLVGALGKQVRLLERITHMQHRHSRREAVRLAIDMERRGEPRDRIQAATGLNTNYLRQVMFRARAAGNLPPMPEGDFAPNMAAPARAAAAAAQQALDLGVGHA